MAALEGSGYGLPQTPNAQPVCDAPQYISMLYNVKVFVVFPSADYQAFLSIE